MDEQKEREDRTNIDYKALGKHIRDARKARGITQDMLAERMNISIGHLGKIERGERMVNLERLAEISVLLQSPIENLIMGCVIDEQGRLLPDGVPVEEDAIGRTFQTMLKGRSERTIRLVIEIAKEIINEVE